MEHAQTRRIKKKEGKLRKCRRRETLKDKDDTDGEGKIQQNTENTRKTGEGEKQDMK